MNGRSAPCQPTPIPLSLPLLPLPILEAKLLRYGSGSYHYKTRHIVGCCGQLRRRFGDMPDTLIAHPQEPWPDTGHGNFLRQESVLICERCQRFTQGSQG